MTATIAQLKKAVQEKHERSQDDSTSQITEMVEVKKDEIITSESNYQI